MPEDKKRTTLSVRLTEQQERWLHEFCARRTIETGEWHDITDGWNLLVADWNKQGRPRIVPYWPDEKLSPKTANLTQTLLQTLPKTEGPKSLLLRSILHMAMQKDTQNGQLLPISAKSR